MKFNFDDAKKRESRDGLTLFELFDSGHFDVVLVEINGSHMDLINTTSDRLYIILEGEVYAEVGDGVFDCRPHDLLLIPKDTKYSISGKAKFLRLVYPPFSPESEQAS